MWITIFPARVARLHGQRGLGRSAKEHRDIFLIFIVSVIHITGYLLSSRDKAKNRSGCRVVATRTIRECG
jgi:hypothetical protein